MLCWFLPHISMNRPQVYVCSLPLEPPSRLRAHRLPTPMSQGARPLCHAASAHWLVILHTVVRMFKAAPLHVFFGEVSQSSDHFWWGCLFSWGWAVWAVYCSSVSKSGLTLQPHGLQHARLPCPSLSPGVYSNSCPLSQWCHPTIASSVVPLSSCP